MDRKYKRGDEPSADFFDFVAYGSAADFAEKYLHKGIKILVTARCQKRSYTNKEGRKVTVTEFIVEDQEFAENKREQEKAEEAQTDKDGYMYIPEDADDSGLPFN